jgi:hypothetical protein
LSAENYDANLPANLRAPGMPICATSDTNGRQLQLRSGNRQTRPAAISPKRSDRLPSGFFRSLVTDNSDSDCGNWDKKTGFFKLQRLLPLKVGPNISIFVIPEFPDPHASAARRNH